MKANKGNKVAAENFDDRLSRVTDHILASDAIEFKELKAYFGHFIRLGIG
jgi:hypothetical protein